MWRANAGRLAGPCAPPKNHQRVPRCRAPGPAPTTAGPTDGGGRCPLAVAPGVVGAPPSRMGSGRATGAARLENPVAGCGALHATPPARERRGRKAETPQTQWTARHDLDQPPEACRGLAEGQREPVGDRSSRRDDARRRPLDGFQDRAAAVPTRGIAGAGGLRRSDGQQPGRPGPPPAGRGMYRKDVKCGREDSPS